MCWRIPSRREDAAPATSAPTTRAAKQPLAMEEGRLFVFMASCGLVACLADCRLATCNLRLGLLEGYTKKQNSDSVVFKIVDTFKIFRVKILVKLRRAIRLKCAHLDIKESIDRKNNFVMNFNAIAEKDFPKLQKYTYSFLTEGRRM